MSSLAVESNYSNMTAARGRRRMVIRNPDNTTTITHTTSTPYTTTATNYSASGQKNPTSTSNHGSNNSLNNLTAGKPSSNIIYNLKSGEGVVTCNNNEPSPSAMSASLALLNRIKSLENQKKRNNQLSSTAIKAAAAAATSAAIPSTPLYNSSNTYRAPPQKNSLSQGSLNNEFHSNDGLNRSASPLPSPSPERRGGKFNRQASFSKSQEEVNKMRVKSANPNVYKDKITDQKFFSRNFKVCAKSGSASSSQNNLAEQNHANIMRYLNESPSDSDMYTARINSNNTNTNGNYEKDLAQLNLSLSNQSPAVSQTNMHHGSATTSASNQANNPHLNKLKLLKKRNALKKTLSNAANANSENTSILPGSKSQERLDPLHLSKEDLKSQTSLTNLVNTNNISTKNLSRHLSRQSLNNLESYNGSSNHLNGSSSQQQIYHKSTETVDELTFADLKTKDLRQSRLSFRAQSNKSLVNTPNIPNNNLAQTLKAKSENELANEEVTTTYELPAIEASKRFTTEPKIEPDQVNEAQEATPVISNQTAQVKFEKQVSKSARVDLNNSNNSRENKAIIANSNYLTSRDRVKSSNQYLNQYSKSALLPKRDKSNESGKITANQANASTQQTRNDLNNSTSRKNTTNNNDFRIVYPGQQAEPTPPQKQVVNDEPNLDYIDPNNIMSDPVIMEQFRKLYAEDEYFQQVHRKCCEWLLRYVIPEMEAAQDKLINHENY